MSIINAVRGFDSDLTQMRSVLFGIIRYLASSASLLECHYWVWCVPVSVQSLSPFQWHTF